MATITSPQFSDDAVGGSGKIFSLCRWNKLEELKTLITSSEDVLIVDEKTGNQPIHLGAQNGHLDLVQFLIKQGADVNAQNKKGNTALHMSVEYDYIGRPNF